ncbi:MAG: AsmA family protein [Bryobacteraceae bacterium]
MKRLLIAGAVLFFAIAAAIPFLETDRFSGSIREALERTLHRKVVVGKVSFHLITGPGFSVKDVVIYDEPAVSLEPLAYVTELDVRLHWRSLVRRRLELNSLRLVEPSLNLTRVPAGYWNFQQLLRETLGDSRGGVPSIQVRGGRINFKSGTLKSAFYITNADLDLSPAAGFENRFRLRFTGEPARTDRGAQGFGRLAASGWWHSPQYGESELDMDLEMERSGIADLMTLIAGRDIGLHGAMTSRAHLSGRMSSLDIKGQMRLLDVHRWDLLPTRAAQWPLSYRGHLDLLSQTLDLDTVQDGDSKLPFVIRVRAGGFFSQPRWAVSATVEGMPAAYLRELATQLGTASPERLALEGKIDGVIGYSSLSGAQGQLVLKDASVELPGAGGLRAETAHLTVNGDAYHLESPEVRTADDQSATVEGDYNRQTEDLQFTVATSALSSRSIQAAISSLFSASYPPVLRDCDGGVWQGKLHYDRQGREPGTWTGTFLVENTDVKIAGLTGPVHLVSAAVALNAGMLTVSKVKGAAGDTAFTAEYKRGADKTDHLQISIAAANATDLEQFLAPSLQRKQSFLARALRRPAPLPEWLQSRRVEGSVKIASLKLVDAEVAGLRGQLVWNGPVVTVSALEGRLAEAHGKGTLHLNLRAAEPQYKLEGRLAQFPWRGGQVDVDGSLETAGLGTDLWLNLTSAGSLIARSFQAGGDEIKSVVGTYDFSVVRGAPRFQMTDIELVQGQDTYSGQGGTQTDGRLQFELASGHQKMRLAGTLSPFQVEIAR